MNAVRVHAHVSDGEFYEACDELGLLVLQDFPLQWTHRRSILGPAVAQAGEMARILRGNPSVGIYLAHDEPFFVAPPEKWSALGLLRTAAEVLSPRWMLWQRRVLDPAVVRAISEEDDARPVIDAAGHPLTTNHLYFGWYYGKFRDLERVVKVFPRILAAADGVWGTGAARSRIARGDLAFNDAARLERTFSDLPPPGPAYDPLRSVEGRSGSFLAREPALSGRGPETRHGAVPAPQVQADGRDIRLHAKRSSTCGVLVRRGLATQAQDGLRGPPCGDEPGPDLCRVSEGALQRRRKVSLPLFVINDLSRDLGGVSWDWELLVGGSSAAHGGGETKVPKDSVVRIGEAVATLPASGPAVLRLRLFGEEGPVSNEYEFVVSQAGARAHRDPSARGG